MTPTSHGTLPGSHRSRHSLSDINRKKEKTVKLSDFRQVTAGMPDDADLEIMSLSVGLCVPVEDISVSRDDNVVYIETYLEG
jgi:hypothetical protein